MKNAIHYSPKGGEITIEIKNDDRTAQCIFSDQGAGFSEKAVSGMHNPFSPGEEHVDKNKGLDLVLVGLIMKAHKGKIEVSNNSHGAIVTLTFPCPKYQNIPVKEIEG